MMGIVDQSGAVIVSIRNLPAGESRWLRVGDRFGDLHLLAADPEIGRAEVTVAGEAHTLYVRMPDRNVANTRAPVATLYNPSIAPGTPAYERVQEREQLMNDYRGQLTEMMTRPGGPAGLAESTPAAGLTEAVAGDAEASPEVAAAPVPDDGKTVEQREREARELMSDMLEIGMIQRQAYQQLKEAAEREGTDTSR